MPNFTKSAIKASFLKLLSEKPLNKISVRDIVEDCGINRNSFYYHYRDIPTLLGEIISETVNSLIIKYPTVNSIGECLDVALEFMMENKKAVFHIYNSVSRDIYEKATMRLCDYTVRTYFSTVFGNEAISESDREIIISFFKCTVYGLSFEWLESGMKPELQNRLARMTELCRGLSDELIRRSKETS